MKTKDIEVGGVYAVKNYKRKAGVRARVVQIGVSLYGPGPGKYIEVEHRGAYLSKVVPSGVLRVWTAEDDAAVEAENVASDRRDELDQRVKDLVAEIGMEGVYTLWGGDLRCTPEGAIALLERALRG
jgi:hypothetical protein